MNKNMCAVDGMKHGSHGIYEKSGGENYPLKRQVVRYNSNSQARSYSSNSGDYN